AALVLAAVLLGTSGVAGALWDSVQSTAPLTITLLRIGFAIPFLLLITAIAGRSEARPDGSSQSVANTARSRTPWRLIGALGTAFAASQSMFFEAIPLAGVTLVVIISLCSTVLFVALLSIPMFGERLNGRGLLAVALALAGTVTLALAGEAGQAGQAGQAAPSLAETPNYLWGLLAALGSGVGLAAYMLLAKLATKRSDMPRSRLLAWTLAVALVMLVPLATISGGVQLDLAPGAWGLALYVGVVATGLAYWLLQVGLQSSSATVASVVTLLEPAVAGLLAWLLLGESLTALQLGGAALLLGSVVLLTWPTAEANLPLVRVGEAREAREAREDGYG
ncbi:MAG TPA: EamA family transporter, partial [Chloroflexia bacterium]|nr:EamA family transporter [Chloroflexia bacterium]